MRYPHERITKVATFALDDYLRLCPDVVTVLSVEGTEGPLTILRERVDGPEPKVVAVGRFSDAKRGSDA